MRHILSLILGVRCAAAPFSLEVSVVDESGVPILGAGVSCDSVPHATLDPWNAPSRRVRVEAAADRLGVARLSGEHDLPELVALAAAPGFHPAGARVSRADSRLRLVLPRRLGSAVSSRVSLVTRAMPEDGAEHGFDLVMGAFVAPLGVGKVADVGISGRCPSARLPRGVPGAYVDEARMRFAGPGAGVVAAPRPGQAGFAESVSPACAGMLLPDLAAPRVAPAEGYVDQLVYRSARGPAPTDLAGPGRVGAPQWMFRIRREGVALHGLITDFGWLPDGRLRLDYQVSAEPGNPSLEF